jgi:hypothetical protein
MVPKPRKEYNMAKTQKLTLGDSFYDIASSEFKDGLLVQKALKELGLTFGDKIVTSRDSFMPALLKKLRKTTLPDGFEQWQLPIVLGGAGDCPVMLFMTIGHPNAKVLNHRHKNDSLFRIVLSGSIIYKGTELFAGDWIYIPRGHRYSFTAGRFGFGCVVMHISTAAA